LEGFHFAGDAVAVLEIDDVGFIGKSSLAKADDQEKQ
jgi:hypothetical protein